MKTQPQIPFRFSMFILMFVLLIAACNSQNPLQKESITISDKDMSHTESSASSTLEEKVALPGSLAATDGEPTASNSVGEMSSMPKQSKLIYTGNINMQVKKYSEARNQLLSLAKLHGAYISSETETSNETFISNTIAIRVPSVSFDRMMNGVSELAETVESKNVYTNDVTAQYIDVAARLKTKREVEATYLELLKKAFQISDIIEIQEHLRVIREEIESAEGQLRYWDDQVSWSTITVYMHEKDNSNSKAPGFFKKMGKSFANGWSGLLQIILAMVTVWPLWLFIAVFVFFLRYIIRRLSSKKT